jgi:hypothetical protein
MLVSAGVTGSSNVGGTETCEVSTGKGGTLDGEWDVWSGATEGAGAAVSREKSIISTTMHTSAAARARAPIPVQELLEVDTSVQGMVLLYTAASGHW